MMPTSATKGAIYRCVGCGKTFPQGPASFCDCGQFIDVHYDLRNARLRDSSDPCIRFFDLLPIEDFTHLIPQDHGTTPCRHAKALGVRLGLPHLYLKDETVLPTGTTKDRMARVVLSFFRETGVLSFSASSTGNSSTAFAHWAKFYPECKVHLFVGEDFLPYLQVDPANDQVAVFAMRGATFVEAANEANRFAERKGITADRGFFSLARREGLKMAFLEATEQVPRPIDWYVQAVSSAMGVYGAYKGARELLEMGQIHQLPRLLCVQQESNRPMVRAFEAGSPVIRPEDVVARPSGIARGILRGDPSRVYPCVRQMVLDSRGTMVAVSEQEIRDAQRMVEEMEGIRCCFNASAAVAGLGRLVREGRFPTDETVVVNLTGSERQAIPPARVSWLERQGDRWRLENPQECSLGAMKYE